MILPLQAPYVATTLLLVGFWFGVGVSTRVHGVGAQHAISCVANCPGGSGPAKLAVTSKLTVNVLAVVVVADLAGRGTKLMLPYVAVVGHVSNAMIGRRPNTPMAISPITGRLAPRGRLVSDF